jgi:glycosyltransferase involved in cell wall biosynthesis
VRLVVAGAGSTTFPLSDPRAEVRAGYLPEDGIESFFAGTSIAVLPYTQASQTGVGSLAVGSGVPVVASRIGGLPDLTLDASYLCAPGDSEGLAAAILRHLDDGVDVRKRVLAEVAGPRGWDAASAQTLALYEELIARR